MGAGPRRPTCWRCSICDINYPPALPQGTPCSVCDSALSAVYGPLHHPDWEERVRSLLAQLDAAAAEARMPNATAKIRKHRKSKTHWVKKQDLLAAGYTNIQSLQIVRINDKYYEIQGFDSASQEYWVEEVIEKLTDEELSEVRGG